MFERKMQDNIKANIAIKELDSMTSNWDYRLAHFYIKFLVLSMELIV